MTSPAGSGPNYDRENLRLAYSQQVENVREAKRLQWQLTYLGLVALGALAGAYQLLRNWNPPATSLGARIFTALGGLGAIATGWIIVRAMRAIGTHRKALEEVAEKLDDSSHPHLKALLGIPPDYGSRRDPEPILLLLALGVGAGVLAWLLLGARAPGAPPVVGVSILASAGWWPPSPEGGAAVGGTVVALVALLKQYRDERNRRRAVDGRISAQAYAARRTIQHGWLEHPQRKPTGVVSGQGEVNAGTTIVGRFHDVEVRFEKMAADAPDGSKDVGGAVREALVLFYRATHRIQAELYRFQLIGGPKNAAEFITAFGEFEACVKALGPAIDKDLRDK